MTKVTESNNNSKKFKKMLLSVFKKFKIKTYKALRIKALKRGFKKMSNTTDEELVKSWIKNLETSELIELWETLTSEINNPSVIWDMDFFLEDYLPGCLNAKTMDVLELARIVTGKDGCVEHFDINDDYVYINHLGLWESINEYGIIDLVTGFIEDYDAKNYSDIIKNKLSEIKEDFGN